MNKSPINRAAAAAIAASIVWLAAACQSKGPMTKKGNEYQVNTTTLCPEVMGYNGPTPLVIHIKDDRVQRIEALANDESPSYFDDVRQDMLPQWEGLSVADALKADVDAISGSTYSSEAVMRNVEVGLKYYQSNH
ncbi:MAG: FMN-binding protein [Bacteroidales bacterium]|nr:FMN-binding protein [Bacteroidales bacterium]